MSRGKLSGGQELLLVDHVRVEEDEIVGVERAREMYRAFDGGVDLVEKIVDDVIDVISRAA